jgi:hypothetical protein
MFGKHVLGDVRLFWSSGLISSVWNGTVVEIELFR